MGTNEAWPGGVSTRDVCGAPVHERDFERELTSNPVNMNPHEAGALARGLGLIAGELRENHETVKAGFLSLDQRLGRVEADVAVLKTDVAILKTDVATLKTDVAVLKTDFASLKTTVENIEAILERMEDRETRHPGG